MFRSRRGFRPKLVHFIQKSTLYGSWALGLFPFTYDAWARKLKPSRWLIVYGLILHAGLIWLVLMNDTETETPSRMEIFKRNPLAEQINNLHDILSLTIVMFAHIRNYWRSEDLSKILNELMDIQHYQFRHYLMNDCKNYDYYIIYKGLSILLEFISLMVLEIGMSPNYSQSFIFGIVSLCIVQFSMLLLAMHYHLAVVTIYRYIWIINKELLMLANRLRSGRQVNDFRLTQLLSIYTRLLELNRRITGIYDYQITCIMLLFLTANIIGIFLFIIFAISLNKTLTLAIWLIFPQTLLVNFIDFWVGIAVCELAERTGKSTSVILRLFNDIEHMDKELEQSINDLALLCTHRPLRFHHCGLFYVNFQMGFRMIISSFLYLLWLVQFDFRNL
ncbi:gustatory receptor for bitter taste 22e-like [Drosophila willistoni]|uniref:gustatory receptor for bitter taste 22e-like n=1 Tax=Drosophila willistoni TaxID=7260 RepID=UPI000C26D22E|nr:gustatory receptor for bitter taste 22e-like [Drosophila willistoni]